MTTRAVLFDLDGTLVDSVLDIAAALAAALADHELLQPSEQDVRAWVGDGARALCARAAAAAGAPDRTDAIHARFLAHYRAAPVVHTRVYAGLDAALDRIVAAGAAIAILSNKPDDLTGAVAAALLGRWPFRPIVGARPGVPLKPDPAAALALAGALGVPPGACAFVGDSGVDVATARAARMRAVAVTWGLRPAAELRAAGADAVVDAPPLLVDALRLLTQS